MAQFMEAIHSAVTVSRCLLENLGFHQVLAKVEVLNDRIAKERAQNFTPDSEDNKAGELKSLLFSSFADAAPLRVETMSKLNLPRVVVIGDEKAGKSSTLERFSMVEVLPRDVAFCTRQPVVLKLRYDPKIPQGTPRFILTIPDDLESSEGVNCQEFDNVTQIRTLIEARMVAIKESGQGILMDSEITVEIHSSGVPTIDLVDLPGLISVLVEEPGEPENLAELSEMCTKKYACVHFHDGLPCLVTVLTQVPCHGKYWSSCVCFGRNDSESPHVKSHSSCSRNARLSQSQCNRRILQNGPDKGCQLERQSRRKLQEPFLQNRKLDSRLRRQVWQPGFSEEFSIRIRRLEKSADRLSSRAECHTYCSQPD